MNSALRTPQSAVRTWCSWLIFLLLFGHLIFCHGCHGEDVDDELSVPLPAARNEERQASMVSDASQKRLCRHPTLLRSVANR
jgi:hypothetical protein